MEKNVWIEIEFVSTFRLEGKDELVSELKENYNVQARDKWLPAACEDTEMFFRILLNSPLGEFFQQIVVPGLQWDLTKSAIALAFTALTKFVKRNKEVNIQKLDLAFDDIIIRVEDIRNEVTYGHLAQLFSELYKHVTYLRSQGLEGIVQIILPFEADTDENGNPFYISSTSEAPYTKQLWKVIYENGCMDCYYNPELQKIMD